MIPLVVLALVVAAIILHLLWPFLAGRGGAYSTSSVSAAEWAFRRIGVAGRRVYDLGCGYGVILALARRMGAVPIGVEIDPLRWLICSLRCRCRVILGDMFQVPLADADVVYIFQWPSVNARLAEKFLSELRPGAYVVSYMWEVPRLKLVAYEPVLKIYIYQV
ncbi:class I SAM-dependent methyltransferase [Pyrobaculum aerophilum]|uniref:RNA methyltransferase n=1 Tax=Pyrobaculum aerophilum TaxID=13773 RepID=A0A371QZ58_9CREN|nr:class I SAM-dependent methyltransferase [Pyrobaculum aerophilum]RFA96057.1 RNA methyltransferase [Pyrobaculum aerophilum]RFA96790.1 RNA methyltransferase [Pyrobaculum aerophilum]